MRGHALGVPSRLGAITLFRWLPALERNVPGVDRTVACNPANRSNTHDCRSWTSPRLFVRLPAYRKQDLCSFSIHLPPKSEQLLDRFRVRSRTYGRISGDQKAQRPVRAVANADSPRDFDIEGRRLLPLPDGKRPARDIRGVLGSCDRERQRQTPGSGSEFRH